MPIPIPVFQESCCGCCSLKTGSKIIAWLALISSILFLVGSIVDQSKLQDKSTDKKDPQLVITASIIVQVLLFAACLSNLLGVYKEKPQYMTPWMIITAVSIILQIIFLIIRIIYTGFLGQTVGYVINIGLEVYFLLIVHSYYRVLVDSGSGIGV